MCSISTPYASLDIVVLCSIGRLGSSNSVVSSYGILLQGGYSYWPPDDY